MNKDVVYIEPEDDITDIIARVKGAKQKLVALVPPKKIGVLRSAVNTKLIAKAARLSEKVVVIVTTDSSLIKLAAAAQIPVAKNLQSRPKLPSEIIREEKENPEQFIDEKDYDDEVDPEEALKTSKNATPVMSQHSRAQSANAKKADQEITSDDIERDEEKSEKSGKKSAKSDKKGVIPTLEKYRKWIILGVSAFIVLVVFLVWAFVFAPAADIAVAVRTTANNFSENVTFTTKSGSENPTSGNFLLEQKKVEKTSSVEFTATGQKNIGEKAKGVLTLTATFGTETAEAVISAKEGATFSYGDLKYTLTKSVNFHIDEEDNCTVTQLRNRTCTITTTAEVIATESGENYNIGPHDSGWTSPVNDISAKNDAAFTGGTTNMVTVVSEQDFNTAKEKLVNQGREDGKAELVKQFGDDMITIESSLEVSTSDPKSTPAVGEEVKSGVTPKVEATTTYTMFAVDKTKVEEFIKTKTASSVAADQKIYAIDKPFFENFTKQSDTSYTAKLKSATQTGPKVTEEDILEKSRGKKIGEVTSLLKSINGVSSVKITPSFPWVSVVPDDPNKITIELKVEE